MLNRGLKKEARTKLEESVERYDRLVPIVSEKAEQLFELRQNSGENVIQPVENYINNLANSPKEFDKSFAEYKAEFETFNELIQSLNQESVNTDIKAGGTAVAGVAAGAGTVALMPTAAMAIATTFGTASTGTAIASLSGAAASKAALAWLGGGALVKGGAGIAGGKALLALAGPIGWGLGAAGVIGGGLYANSKNKKISKEMNEKRKEIETQNTVLNASIIEIKELIGLTEEHQNGILSLLGELNNLNKDNYNQFNDYEKQQLGSLVNHIKSLSALLNKKVS